MQQLPICLLQYLFDFMSFKTQIAFRKTNKRHYNLYIKSLYELDFSHNITDDVLKQPVYKYVTKLSLYTDNITNIAHLPLKVLNIGDMVKNARNLIKKLYNLEELKCNYTTTIYDLNHMQKLKVLHCRGYYCSISNESICKLYNLEALYCDNNPRITNINHMQKLKVLHCNGYCCGISNESICKLYNLEVLYSDNINAYN